MAVTWGDHYGCTYSHYLTYFTGRRVFSSGPKFLCPGKVSTASMSIQGNVSGLDFNILASKYLDLASKYALDCFATHYTADYTTLH